MKGFSSQVGLFPVVFKKGEGNVITDVDGNTYIDFSSGIYCNSTRHCHPKVVEKIKEGKYEIFSFWGDWHGKTGASMGISSQGCRQNGL